MIVLLGQSVAQHIQTHARLTAYQLLAKLLLLLSSDSLHSHALLRI